MRDLNFFEPYLIKKTNFFGGKTGKYILIAGTTIVLTVYPLYNGLQILKANREVATVGVLVQSSEIREGKNLMKDLAKQRQDLDLRKQKLLGLEETYREKDVINDFLMYTINGLIPESVFLESVRIKDGKVHIQAVSKDKRSIALLERNLRKNEEFKDVFISSIIENFGSHTFTLSFFIKGGDEE